MSADCGELRRLIEELPEDEVPAVLGGLRSRLRTARNRPWPPAWFGAAPGRTTDTAARSPGTAPRWFRPSLTMSAPARRSYRLSQSSDGRAAARPGWSWRGPGQGRVSLARAAGQRIERDRRTQLLGHRPDRQLPGHRPRRVVRLDLPVEMLRVRSVDLRPVVPALGVVQAVGLADHIRLAPVPDQVPNRGRVPFVGAHDCSPAPACPNHSPACLTSSASTSS